MTRFANRTRELHLFEQMLRRQVRERILLIEAPSGYGKTGLMGRFERLCSQEIHPVLIDLKGAQAGIAFVFSRIQRVLGKKRFPNFNAQIDRFLNSGVEIQNNRLTGEGSQIQVILDVPPEERKYRLTQLQQVFFEDLERFDRPIAFILDTYNGATEELADGSRVRFWQKWHSTQSYLQSWQDKLFPNPLSNGKTCIVAASSIGLWNAKPGMVTLRTLATASLPKKLIF
jgi:hypothetical protein